MNSALAPSAYKRLVIGIKMKQELWRKHGRLKAMIREFISWKTKVTFKLAAASKARLKIPKALIEGKFSDDAISEFSGYVKHFIKKYGQQL